MIRSGSLSNSFFSDNNGFTLIEVMLVLAILAGVVSMISLSLSGTFAAIEATEKKGELYNQARIAMQRISEDLAMAVFHEDMVFTGVRSDIDGRRADSIEFASMAHIIFDESGEIPGMAGIVYQVRKPVEGGDHFVLLRSDSLLRPQDDHDETEEEPGFVLCDKVYSLEFSFFDKEGEEFEEWNAGQDSEEEEVKRELPVMVRVTLTFWLNDEEQETTSFTTKVVLPTGLIQPPATEKSDDSA